MPQGFSPRMSFVAKLPKGQMVLQILLEYLPERKVCRTQCQCDSSWKSCWS
uniref:Uncharacterized protein n=1 Tax=Rhizophora mucronata TaxID=61149 RepID=A0A2P2KV10_RHIMU